MRFGISLDLATWTWFLQTFAIHPKFIESLYYLLGTFSTFVTYDQDGTAGAFHLLVKIPPVGHLEAAFYVRYDFKAKKTLILIAGNDPEGQMEMLSERLSETHRSTNPFVMIFAIITQYYIFLEYQRRMLDHSVIMLERVTGRGAVTYSAGKPEDPERFDIQNMHWVGGNQRNIVFAMDFQIKLVGFLLGAHHQYVSLLIRRAALFEYMSIDDKSIQEALQSHRSTFAGVLDNCQIIKERAQQQLNAADRIISTTIAKQSQRTADESKIIAVETRRDSTSMKTIASLTMVYLPSTFLATIFSTGFFSTASGILEVNSEIWKLVICAGALTFITIFVRVWLSKRGVLFFLRWAKSSPFDINSTTQTTVASAVEEKPRDDIP